ncbi:hypothetical protein CHGG_10881 [Chaetomium globosum CBS 148.51]|uniref:ATP-dependent DNA helicase n=1 Tax=Chaetomium globosum (strain ATCC 6205 / CBS 148.51 / DSM 1962 / NBRC 6347 / NRRL 1970) TaxID=306901 RepID=Q2GMC3_CHAGB|nr:uncharacterized protein CHGG_10881 [Chaetomium globosum CBS 148.51]EAQ83063.1 hypothetical protein CHGG_10881 [Chaetomium globosum CBS 148.51]
MFRLKDGLHTLLLTGASGNAAALIGGVTLHSAMNIGFEGKNEVARNVSEEEKLRWKNMVMLIVDEISQVGGLTLAAVDNRLRQPASSCQCLGTAADRDQRRTPPRRRLTAADPWPLLLRPRHAGRGDSQPVCRAEGRQRVNGAPFMAVDIFPDLAFGTIALTSDVTLHLGPPVVVLLQSDDSADLAIPGLPNDTILVKSKTVAIPSQMRGKEGRWRGKPGFRRTPRRHSDSAQFHKSPESSDFIEPKNVLDKDMRDAILKPERQGEETRRRFEQDHRHESWFQEWDVMAESAQIEAADEEAGASL